MKKTNKQLLAVIVLSLWRLTARFHAFQHFETVPASTPERRRYIVRFESRGLNVYVEMENTPRSSNEPTIQQGPLATSSFTSGVEYESINSNAV